MFLSAILSIVLMLVPLNFVVEKAAIDYPPCLRISSLAIAAIILDTLVSEL